MATTIGRIEHSGNCVYAIHTDAGVAIYPTLDDLADAIRSGSVEVGGEDQGYYDERGAEWPWNPVSQETLEAVGLA